MTTTTTNDDQWQLWKRTPRVEGEGRVEQFLLVRINKSIAIHIELPETLLQECSLLSTESMTEAEGSVRGVFMAFILRLLSLACCVFERGERVRRRPKRVG